MSVTQVVQTGTCTHANDYKWAFWWHSTRYSRMSLHSTLHLHLRKVMGVPSMGTASHSISAITCCDYWVTQGHFPPSSGAVQTLPSEWRVKIESRSICEYQGQSSTNFNRGDNAWGPWTRFRCMLKKPGCSKLPDLSTTASLNRMTVLGQQTPNNIIVILDKNIIKTTKTNKTITNISTMSGGKPSPIVLNVGNAFVLSKKMKMK